MYGLPPNTKHKAVMIRRVGEGGGGGPAVSCQCAWQDHSPAWSQLLSLQGLLLLLLLLHWARIIRRTLPAGDSHSWPVPHATPHARATHAHTQRTHTHTHTLAQHSLELGQKL